MYICMIERNPTKLIGFCNRCVQVMTSFRMSLFGIFLIKSNRILKFFPWLIRLSVRSFLSRINKKREWNRMRFFFSFFFFCLYCRGRGTIIELVQGQETPNGNKRERAQEIWQENRLKNGYRWDFQQPVGV